MKFIWDLVRKTNFETDNKARLFLFICSTCCAGIGYFTLLLTQSALENSMAATVLFTLCPAFFIGMLGGIWYLYQNDI